MELYAHGTLIESKRLHDSCASVLASVLEEEQDVSPGESPSIKNIDRDILRIISG